MKTGKNLVIGTVLAALLLAPEAWADASQLLKGTPPALSPSATGLISGPIAHMAHAGRGTVSQLTSSLLAELGLGERR